MKITYQWMTCLILLAVGSLPSPSMAEHRWVGFSELVHRAQVIFDGRVIDQVSWESDDGKMILTDVTFDLIDLVHADPQALAFIGDTITITMPGGTFGGRSLNVCTTPHLNHGERVLLCAYLDGKKHISPVVGGEQGVFRIMERGRQLEPIPTKGHAFGLLGIQGEHLHISPRIERIEGNEGVFFPPPRLAPMGRSLDHNPDPVATVLRGRGELMTLRQLKTAMQERLEIAFDARATTGSPPPQRLPIPAGKELNLEDRDADDPPVVSPLCVCGDHHFGAMYEIPPPGSVNRDDELYAMSHWHRFVNNLLWRDKDRDDACGINFENEIGVFADEEYFDDCWGDWDEIIPYGGDSPARAICFSWSAFGGCDQELIEIDTVYNTQHYWPPDYDRNEYRGVAMHELGHSWGFLRGDCAETYQYDQLTIMAGSLTRETFNGIHAADAYYIRGVYDYYLGPFGDVADIGCEDYVYIEGNSYGELCDQCQFPLEPGDEFTIKNILVESMSSAPVPATLYFVASEDEHLDWDEDIIIGTFGFDELPPFSSVNGDYTMSIPDYLPAGTHNLLIHVALYDFIDNDRNPENNTCMARLPLTIINNAASNDNCSSPQTITEGRWLVDNRWADTDGGTLPSCDDEFMYPMWHDVWYSYQSDCGGILELDTCTGQGFNTIIALYEDTGECPPDPNSMIACSNDSDLCTDYRSYLFTQIKANTPYRIRVGTPFPEDVGSPGGSMGQAVLNVNLYPGTLDGTPNDECVGAIQVDKGAHDFSTSCATNQDIMDPGLCTDDGVIHNDLWYSFTASCSGTARLTAFSQQFDTAIAVYDPGFACVNNVNALLGSACATADDPSPKVMLEVIAGQELLIRVGGQNPDDRGGASLQIGLIKRAPNDTSEEAILIEGDIVLDTTCALSEGMFHAGCSPI
ncbi:MAG: hypothetical protein MK089_12415, partial [Phycisphaerales bacterium]|nr:hypothetical protein [Phycisphaerales bacterium]